MTTVVVDRLNRKIVADTKLSNSNGTSSEIVKVFKENIEGEEVLFGISGVVVNALILKNFFVDNGFKSKNKPEFKNYGNTKSVEVLDNDFELMVLFRNKKLVIYSIYNTPIEITEKYYCTGSGGEYAKAIITYETIKGNDIDFKNVFKAVSVLDRCTNNKITFRTL